jgi:hypothetical protein
MNEGGATRPGGPASGRSQPSSSSVALNVVLFWSWSGKDNPVREKSGAARPIGAQLAESSPSPPPTKPLRAEGPGERPQPAVGSSRPEDENKATPRPEGEVRGWAHQTSPSGTAASQTYAHEL